MAEMVCRSVQVLRPSCSTSGGQSAGGVRGVVEVEGGVLALVLVVEVVLDEEEGATCRLVRAEKSAYEVQDLHLEWEEGQRRG